MHLPHMGCYVVSIDTQRFFILSPLSTKNKGEGMLITHGCCCNGKPILLLSRVLTFIAGSISYRGKSQGFSSKLSLKITHNCSLRSFFIQFNFVLFTSTKKFQASEISCYVVLHFLADYCLHQPDFFTNKQLIVRLKGLLQMRVS